MIQKGRTTSRPLPVPQGMYFRDPALVTLRGGKPPLTGFLLAVSTGQEEQVKQLAGLASSSLQGACEGASRFCCHACALLFSMTVSVGVPRASRVLPQVLASSTWARRATSESRNRYGM